MDMDVGRTEQPNQTFWSIDVFLPLFPICGRTQTISTCNGSASNLDQLWEMRHNVVHKSS